MTPGQETQPGVSFALFPAFAESHEETCVLNTRPSPTAPAASLGRHARCRGARSRTACACASRGIPRRPRPPCSRWTYAIRYLCRVRHPLAPVFKDRLPSWDFFIPSWSPFGQKVAPKCPTRKCVLVERATGLACHLPRRRNRRLVRYQVSMCRLPPSPANPGAGRIRHQVHEDPTGGRAASEVCKTPRTTGRTGGVADTRRHAHRPSADTGEKTDGSYVTPRASP